MSRRKKSSRLNHGDVTINDFANAEVAKNRAKKASNNVNTVIKQLECDKAWDEKDYDSYDFVKEKSDDGTVSYVYKQTKHIKTSLMEASKSSKDVGKDYPLDVWFLISEFVKPEDVGTFSCICKTSYEVTNTAKFWFNLYKRYYINVPNLPERLKPKCMLRLYGVRTLAIRALYYMYPPFINRCQIQNLLTKEHPSTLTNRQCTLMWHSKNNSKGVWMYYFKLKEVNNRSQRAENYSRYDLLDVLDDVAVNTENNCKILAITSQKFVAVELVQGLFLTIASISLASNLRHNKVQLGFSTSIHYSSRTLDGSSCTNIVFDWVVNMKILDWWHPLYPHSYNMELLLNQE